MDKDSSSSINNKAGTNRASSSQVRTPELTATLEDARFILSAIRGIFGQESWNSTRLIQALLDFFGGRIPPGATRGRMKEALVGHPMLIRGLNDVLPEELIMDLAGERKDVHPNEALGYEQKVKERLKDDEMRYRSFEALLYSYKNGDISVDRLCRRVIEILEGQYDLIDEFGRFVPPTRILGPGS